MIKAKIIGAGGYGGIGLLELLVSHPEVEIGALVGVDKIGVPISDLYPHLKGFLDTKIMSVADSAKEDYDVVFMATPDGVGMSLAQAEVDKGAKVIDYSGDFRFNTPQGYAEYAAKIGKPTQHKAEKLLPDAVYGIPELHRKEISSKTSVIGNPGCFAVSCILGLAPAIQESLVNTDSLICDCKTGVSGAGKTPAPTFHYPARYEAMNAYKLAGHQHVCEIERELGLIARKELKVTFTGQVVPLCRGIMSTLYGTLINDITEAAVLELYEDFYKDDVFVRVFDSNASITSMHVRGTNYCNLTVSVDPRTRRLRIVSYIDNLVKGQAGSAMQNMNLLFGLSETLGLDRPGMYP